MAKSLSLHARRPLLLAAALLLLPGSPAAAAPPVSRPAALITAPVGLAGAHWIWFAEGEPAQSAPAATRYLRRTFTAPAGPYTDAQLVVTGDDTVDVWLNDTYLAGSTRTADSWKTARYVDLAAALKPGSNTLTIAARNTSAGPAGVLGRIRVATAQSTVDLVTDGSWQAADSVPQTWTAAKDLGAYGTGPWRSDVAGPDPGAGSPVTLAGLTTERRTGPVGLDTAKPRFGWRLVSAATGQLQG
ncbi:hypothetical protein AB0C29_28875, partial [Actinoplanes sp. NPDC048791]